MGLALEAAPAHPRRADAGPVGRRDRGFIALVREIARDATVLLIEHNMEVVMGLADRITVLNAGRILAEGTPEQIRANAEVQRAYLGTEAMTDALTDFRARLLLRRGAGAARLVARAQQRRGALPARPQRRRQDHAAEGDHGAGAGAFRLDHARWPRPDEARRARGAEGRRRLCAAGAAAVRRDDGRREHRDRADDARKGKCDARKRA